MYRRIAIMQPYLFPYIGYFSMIKHVDLFVFLDDVNYIKKGWINRNKLVYGDNEILFSVPIKKASQNVNIKDTYINSLEMKNFIKKFKKTLTLKFPDKKKDILELENIMLSSDNISEICQNSIKYISNFLNIDCDFIKSSDLNIKFHDRSSRLINICKHFAADEYINSIGGRLLYTKEEFLNCGIKLFFLNSIDPMSYKSSLQLFLENNFCELENYELI